MSTIPISVTLRAETIQNLDKVRGLTKRSTIIDDILSDYLTNQILKDNLRDGTDNPSNPETVKKSKVASRGDSR